MSSKTAVVLEEKIKSKLISAEENRVEKLNSYLEKLKEHEKHIEEVRKAMREEKEELEEKLLQKYQNALNYREEQIEKIREKIREHQKHASEVREKAKQISPNSSSTALDSSLNNGATSN